MEPAERANVEKALGSPAESGGRIGFDAKRRLSGGRRKGRGAIPPADGHGWHHVHAIRPGGPGVGVGGESAGFQLVAGGGVRYNLPFVKGCERRGVFRQCRRGKNVNGVWESPRGGRRTQGYDPWAFVFF